jgi:hypothetical protein
VIPARQMEDYLHLTIRAGDDPTPELKRVGGREWKVVGVIFVPNDTQLLMKGPIEPR